MQVVAPMSKMRSVHNALLHLGHDSRFIFVVAFHIRPFACRYARTMHARRASKLACAHARTLTCWPLPRPPFLSVSLSHAYRYPSTTRVLFGKLKDVRLTRYAPTAAEVGTLFMHACVCVCVCVCVCGVHVFMNLCVYALRMHMYVNPYAQVWSHKDSILSD